MKPKSIEAFTVSGLRVRTNNKAEASPLGQIIGLWERFYAAHPSPDEHVYGVYSDYESDANGDFTVTAGTRCEEAATPSVRIKSGTYLAFPANGAMPAAIIEAWKAIWAHFSHNHPYARAYETDFEEYHGAESATIFIGIKAGSAHPL